MSLDEMVREFNQLSDDEQRLFLSRIIPAVRRLLISNPEKMIAEIMPLCREMMTGGGCDMSGIMEMMRDSMKR